ncbi:regulator of nonsense transcripts 3B [Drosophila nasuta]|uniref:regulator of nonsense transcripts 3B n=1 Tax=Drosophila nasuta TaxID=42062 RepID=UPI00295E5DCC|nr:regulator of nonsense transcripts 3B [Drosophila nasuta]
MEKPRVNKRKEKKEKSNHAIKIVVRHLPPTMTEQEFLEQVDPLPENDSYYFCTADWSLGQEATCRAYIDMSRKDISDVLQFRDRFDGYVFVDSKGAEYAAIVEYAPFQCFMKNKARNHDNKVNTIEKETHYQDFLQKLADEREEASRLGDLKIDFNIEQRSDDKVKSTPLLQYLANKKEKRREEARKRNEEKRKQREELKLLRAAETPENKSKDAAGDNKKPGNNNNNNQKKEFNKDGQVQDKAKNSRSKRRTERDQRRREEHEQRKLARDREQRDKKKPERTERPEKENPSKKSSKPNQAKEQKLSRDVVILKKETIVDSSAVVSNTDTEKSVDACSERLASDQQDKEERKPPEVFPQNSSQAPNQQESRKSANRRSADERRIRNKDRPSIAIYQPKVRNRLGSEENSPNDSKDAALSTEKPVFPTVSDSTEIPDEKSKNKRFGRRNKQKNPDCKESNERAQSQVSKSSESSTSAHSTTLK